MPNTLSQFTRFWGNPIIAPDQGRWATVPAERPRRFTPTVLTDSLGDSLRGCYAECSKTSLTLSADRGRW